MKSKIDAGDFNRLVNIYPNIWSQGDRKYVLGEYAEKGMRITIYPCTEIERQMDKEHCLNKVEIIFTMYKLLHPGCGMGCVTEGDDIIAAVKKVGELLREIYDKSNVDLLKRAKIDRVDVTCDVMTPSDEYSKEIIRIAKQVVVPYGYKVWNPSEEEQRKHPEWSSDNAAFFNNHSQEIAFKLYNKRADNNLTMDFREELGSAGLVRFELTLKRNFLRKKRYIGKSITALPDIANMLADITSDAEFLLKEYMGNVLSTGDMLSNRILKKYIKRKCDNKIRRAEKMIRYTACISKGKSDTYGSDKSICKVMQYFEELEISPIYTIDKCPYIPSFEKLISGEGIDQKLLCMAKSYNEKRNRLDLVYWR
jgi:hypothetical protein